MDKLGEFVKSNHNPCESTCQGGEKEFLSRLLSYLLGFENFLEIRLLPPGKGEIPTPPHCKVLKGNRFLFSTLKTKYEEILSFCKIANEKMGKNAFFGVFPRNLEGEVVCSEFFILYQDLDIRVATPEEEDEARGRIFAKLQELPFRPTFIINSGRGFHLYWFLQEPLTKAEWVFAQERLCQFLEADPQVAKDIARIMRMPGTKNLKYSDHPLCSVIECGEVVNLSKKKLLEVVKKLSKDSPQERTTPLNEASLSNPSLKEPSLKETSSIASSPLVETPTLDDSSSIDLSSSMGFELPETIPQGARNSTLTRFAGSLRRKGLNEEEIFACLRVVNQTRCEPPLDESEVRRIAKSIARYEAEEELSPLPETFTDYDNAQILFSLFKNKVLYTTSGWFLFDGKKWKRDPEDGAVVELASEELTNFYLKKAEASRGETKEKFIKYALKARSLTHARNTLPYLKSRLKTNLSSFDPEENYYLLNTLSGVVNLKTGELLPHSPEFRFTKITTASYNPEALCPLFNQFLDQIFPNPELKDFVLDLLGYCLLGGNFERLFIIFYGSGANGKSTLTELIKYVLGSYAMEINPNSFMLRKYQMPGAPTPDLAKLPGVRLVIASETHQAHRLDESLVKMLTGGDAVVARHLYAKAEFEYRPQFTPILKTNFRPLARGDDQAFWDRVVLVPFERRFTEEERNPQLLERLKGEAEGILTLLVERAQKYLSGVRLKKPLVVRKATEEYRAETDPLYRFFQEKIEEAPGEEVSAQELYNAYVSWCKEEGEEVATPHKLGKFLLNLGIKKIKKRNANYYKGIRLKDNLPF